MEFVVSISQVKLEEVCFGNKAMRVLNEFVMIFAKNAHGSAANVTAVNKTSTSIFITWDAVPANQSNGDILGYRVNYILTTTLDTRLVNVQTVYANLTGLKRNRIYYITVMAYNQHGDGPPSMALLVKTDEDSKF
ncbi:Protein sidekick-1 [Desmophyllum pertusum]|uniref:Protein sidekick-1 n=1 Tax=Desmophyllum pertusum TaxID=174260 RepID=A0A9W9Z3A4_9CNID|nr:Protein sidekick-1 [Desmophyllum pertusum]